MLLRCWTHHGRGGDVDAGHRAGSDVVGQVTQHDAVFEGGR